MMKLRYSGLGTIVLIIIIMLISGCAEKECKIADDCLSKTCYDVRCKDNKCVYSSVSDCCGNDKCEPGETYENCVDDCPNCNDNNECTTNEYDYHEQKCVNEFISPCCGNGICDKDSETYSSCAVDCLNCDDNNECTKDSYDYHKQECVNAPILGVICCGNGICESGEIYENCANDCPNCDDENKCTKDSYDYHKQECVNEVIIPCCGNKICDKDAETFSNCVTDCPNCNDDNELTTDSFNYAIQKCENPVTYYFIDDFEGDIKIWDFSGEGNWSTEVEDGNTVLRLGHKQANLKEDWTNYAFKFRFKRIDGSMHVNFRHNHIKEGWNRYFTGVSEREVNNLNKQLGDDFQTLKDADFKLSEGWHTLEIRSYDNIINVYVDDELSIKYKDTENPFLSGRVGFEIHTGGAPITPVEETATSSGAMSRLSATRSPQRRASWRPGAPVHALALPLLTRIA